MCPECPLTPLCSSSVDILSQLHHRIFTLPYFMSKKTSDITRLFCSYNNLEQLNSCYVKLAIGVPAVTMTQNLSF